RGLGKRYLFAGVDNFLLYDLASTDGNINEDVFAYSNRYGDERTLVVVHNRFASARGWIKTSVPFSVKTGSGDERAMLQRTLGEGLALDSAGNAYTIFREQASGLEFIRPNADLVNRGLYLELDAYRTHRFFAFREWLC